MAINLSSCFADFSRNELILGFDRAVNAVDVSKMILQNAASDPAGYYNTTVGDFVTTTIAGTMVTLTFDLGLLGKLVSQSVVSASSDLYITYRAGFASAVDGTVTPASSSATLATRTAGNTVPVLSSWTRNGNRLSITVDDTLLSATGNGVNSNLFVFANTANSTFQYTLTSGTQSPTLDRTTSNTASYTVALNPTDVDQLSDPTLGNTYLNVVPSGYTSWENIAGSNRANLASAFQPGLTGFDVDLNNGIVIFRFDANVNAPASAAVISAKTSISDINGIALGGIFTPATASNVQTLTLNLLSLNLLKASPTTWANASNSYISFPSNTFVYSSNSQPVVGGSYGVSFYSADTTPAVLIFWNINYDLDTGLYTSLSMLFSEPVSIGNVSQLSLQTSSVLASGNSFSLSSSSTVSNVLNNIVTVDISAADATALNQLGINSQLATNVWLAVGSALGSDRAGNPIAPVDPNSPLQVTQSRGESKYKYDADRAYNINANVENIQIRGGSSGQVLSTDGLGNLSWADGGAGSARVAGPDTSVQFNDQGSLNGTRNFVYDTDIDQLTLRGNLLVTTSYASPTSISNYANYLALFNYSASFQGNTYFAGSLGNIARTQDGQTFANVDLTVLSNVNANFAWVSGDDYPGLEQTPTTVYVSAPQGNIIYSQDGINWSRFTSPSSPREIVPVEEASGIWTYLHANTDAVTRVTADNTGAYSSSSNLWIPNVANAQGISYISSSGLAAAFVGDTSNNQVLVGSGNVSAPWTQTTILPDTQWNSMISDGDRFVAVSNTGNILTSTNAVDWTISTNFDSGNANLFSQTRLRYHSGISLYTLATNYQGNNSPGYFFYYSNDLLTWSRFTYETQRPLGNSQVFNIGAVLSSNQAPGNLVVSATVGNTGSQVQRLTTIGTQIPVGGSIQTNTIFSDDIRYANGDPWNFDRASGNTNQFQFNQSGNLAGSPSLTLYNETDISIGRYIYVDDLLQISQPSYAGITGYVSKARVGDSQIIKASGGANGNIVSINNDIASSWYTVTTPSTNQNTVIRNLNETLYLFGGTGGNVRDIFVSADSGNTWTPGISLPALPGMNMSYADAAANTIAPSETLVVVSTGNLMTGNTVVYSEDSGTTWNSANIGVYANWTSIVYAQGYFSALGSNSTSSFISISADGTAWVTAQTIANASYDRLVYGKGIYLATSSTNARVLVSSDGFSTVTQVNPSGNSAARTLSLDYNSRSFLLRQEDQVLISADGIGWTTVDNIPTTVSQLMLPAATGGFLQVAANSAGSAALGNVGNIYLIGQGAARINNELRIRGSVGSNGQSLVSRGPNAAPEWTNLDFVTTPGGGNLSIQYNLDGSFQGFGAYDPDVATAYFGNAVNVAQTINSRDANFSGNIQLSGTADAVISSDGNILLAPAGNVGINANIGVGIADGNLANASGYYYGNGAFLTGIVSAAGAYGNSNVALYLGSNSAVDITTQGNLITNRNVQASLINSTGNISASANITAGGNLVATGYLASQNGLQITTSFDESVIWTRGLGDEVIRFEDGGPLTTATNYRLSLAVNGLAGGTIRSRNSQNLTDYAPLALEASLVTVDGNLEISGTSDLGSAADITLRGGTAGQILSSLGSGAVTWSDPAAPGSSYYSGNTDAFNAIATQSEINAVLPVGTAPNTGDYFMDTDTRGTNTQPYYVYINGRWLNMVTADGGD